jgi:hypothetical protein
MAHYPAPVVSEVQRLLNSFFNLQYAEHVIISLDLVGESERCILLSPNNEWNATRVSTYCHLVSTITNSGLQSSFIIANLRDTAFCVCVLNDHPKDLFIHGQILNIPQTR